MATASAFMDMAASADEVWDLIGGFNSLPDWLPAVVKSELSDGGRLRHLETADGVVIVERLQTFDHAGKVYSYSISEGPFPVSDYLATLKVESRGDGARVTWSSVFKAKGVTEQEAEALFTTMYQGGVETLSKHFCS